MTTAASGEIVEAPAWRVRDARPEERLRLAAVLSRAFRDDPVHRWILPSEADWSRGSAPLFALLIGHWMRHGRVLTAEPLAGAAVWAPPGRTHGSLLERLWLALRTSWWMGRRSLQVQEGFARMERARPYEPHWHLSVVGTVAERRGQGLGSALLEPVLRECDADGVTAHLECSKAENVPFYERNGFRVVEELELPRGPRVWPMRRDPKR